MHEVSLAIEGGSVKPGFTLEARLNKPSLGTEGRVIKCSLVLEDYPMEASVIEQCLIEEGRTEHWATFFIMRGGAKDHLYEFRGHVDAARVNYGIFRDAFQLC